MTEVDTEISTEVKTEVEKEKIIEEYPIPVTIDDTNQILNQLKKCICKIENEKGKYVDIRKYYNEYPTKKGIILLLISNIKLRKVFLLVLNKK